MARAGKLIANACFLAGLRKVETNHNGDKQEAWRPKRVYHMIQDRFLEARFCGRYIRNYANKNGVYKSL